jgi:hypothetical protein
VPSSQLASWAVQHELDDVILRCVDQSLFYQSKGTAPVMVLLGLFNLTSIPVLFTADGSGFVNGLVCVPFVVFSGFLIFRVSRIGVHLSRTGLRVVNPLKTFFIPWEQVQSFSVRTGGWRCIGIDRMDGESIPIRGLGVGGGGIGRSTGQALTDLERALAHSRGTVGPESTAPQLER